MPELPPTLDQWFAARGWTPHPHQWAMLDAAAAGRSALLTAPTGGGKTLAGFLPTLADLIAAPRPGLHTLYIAPLKALTQDIHRTLTEPVAEMGAPVALETRTGDTPHGKRRRQRREPPNILLTTPESLALMLSYPDAGEVVAGLTTGIVDELHALAGTKRGDLLALDLVRLDRLAPGVRRVGLSATVAHPEAFAAWLSPSGSDPDGVRHIRGGAGAQPVVETLTPTDGLPWAGHMAVHAVGAVFERLQRARTALVFANTRGQAELVFQELWRLNEPVLPIALHHGSLAVAQRRKVEAAMARGELRAVVATSSLDLGIDWGDVDLVVQMGAPKGVTRLLQRVGRANHRAEEPSRAVLVPANRFEVLECRAALEALDAGELDGEPPGRGGLDVLCQHILASACAGPVTPDGLYGEVRHAHPYTELTRADFDACFAFVDHGGSALKGYRRHRRLQRDGTGAYRVTSPADARAHRLNAGAIVDAPTLAVKLVKGRTLGEVEELFAQQLRRGDTFVFGGERLAVQRIAGTTLEVTRAQGGGAPKVPMYVGSQQPLSTHLAHRVRAILADPARWAELPEPVPGWLRLQAQRSRVPGGDGLLVETFPRDGLAYLVAYTFEGRRAHQTLGMLLTRRMERLGLKPLGFVATDYVVGVWSVARPDAATVRALVAHDLLGDDLEEWMAESSMLRRTFRNVALVAGLIARQIPGRENTGKQISFSADLIYDTLRKHEPDHILLRATRREAATGLTDVARLDQLLARVQGRVDVRALDRISPLAVPVLLEIGRERVRGEAEDALLDEVADDLIAEAGLSDAPA